MTRLFAFVFLLAAAAYGWEIDCHARCDFKFCDGSETLVVTGGWDRPLSSSICKKSSLGVGIEAETGEALVVTVNGVKDISMWVPAGIDQMFTPTFFKAYPLLKNYRYSAIGHEKPQLNQMQFMEGQCFVLPIRHVQFLDKEGNVDENEEPHVYGGERDCIAFQTAMRRTDDYDSTQTGEY